MAPYRWVEQIEAELAAGAWKVIAEARESGTAGIYRADGEVADGPDRRDRARGRPEPDASSRRRARSSRCGSSRASAPRSTSATSPRTTCSRSRRCGSDCARTPIERRSVTILLARHGETDDNIEPIRIQGRRDTPLNDTRARAGARSWPSGWPARASPRCGRASCPRARETAEIVGARLGLEPVIDDAPRGGRSGRLEGRCWRRRRARGSEAVRGMAPRRRDRSASPGASRCASSRTARSPRSPTSGRPGRFPPSSSAHGGSIRVVRCSEDPRGLDAFHDWEVPNVAVVRL